MRSAQPSSPCRLVLASASPRRRALLEQVGMEVCVEPAEGAEAEAANNDLPPAEHAREAAIAKALAASRRRPEHLVLGADTVVALDGRAMGKPRCPGEARAMLAALSERTHRVHTGVAFARGGDLLAAEVVTTRVTFRNLSAAEIEAYVASGEPLDKAGAYGIQGRGAVLVRGIEGCYSNVVGLPLSRVWELLADCERHRQG